MNKNLPREAAVDQTSHSVNMRAAALSLGPVKVDNQIKHRSLNLPEIQMKLLLPLLLAPALVVAQAPTPGQFDEQQMFQHLKGTMLPMMEKSLPVMKQLQACIQQSQNTPDLNKCVDIMTAFQKDMVATMGVPGQTPEPPRPEVEWSEQLKAEMLQDIGKSMQETAATRDCLAASNNGGEMDDCMAKTGLGQR